MAEKQPRRRSAKAEDAETQSTSSTKEKDEKAASKAPARRGRSSTSKRESIHDVKDPAAKVAELEQELFHLRFQMATRQLTNTARLRQVRKDVARYKTIEHQRRLRAAMEAAAVEAAAS